MSQRVLVFEKNTDFVRELESGFTRYGANVEIAQDPDAGLSRAKADKPALVLLSVDAMPTPGEAFLVCKKFKSDDDLANIPFVIMGGPHHADSFESHKKLKKRRADEYVQLPIGFEDLISKLSPLVPFQAASNGALSLDNDSVEVDADIDAFADNAFDDLVLDEGPAQVSAPPAPAPAPVSAPAPAPAPAQVAAVATRTSAPAPAPRAAAPAVDRAPIAPSPTNPAVSVAAAAATAALQEEINFLKAQLTEAGQKAKANEERARTAEDRSRAAEDKARSLEDRARAAEERAKAADAARASLAPPAPSGVSSREYLELREQLNRKDKELLSLRDEVTQRDRQLLDANDRALSLERGQAELGDKLGATERSLHDAQEKIRAYEVDKDAIAKRTEDLKTRLARQDDKVKKLEDELDAIKSVHGNEISELKSAQAKKLEHIEATVSAEVARMRADHASKVQDLEAKHRAATTALEQSSAKALEDARAAHESELSAVRSANARLLEETKAEHASVLARANADAEAALQRAKEDADDALASAKAHAASDKARALEDARAQHQSEMEMAAADAERVKTAALEGLRRELEAKAASEKKELEDRHGKELAVLGRKLSEADANKAVLEERLEDLEQAKSDLESTTSARIASLESDLGTRTDERDRANNELSAARASISSLEKTQASQAERIARLEAQLAVSEDRLQKANTKLASDSEILERVRKALGIGIGLLEQQRQNGVD